MIQTKQLQNIIQHEQEKKTLMHICNYQPGLQRAILSVTTSFI